MEKELLVNGKAFLKGHCDSQHLQSHGKTQTALWIQGGVWTEPRTRQKKNNLFFTDIFSVDGFVFEHLVVMKCKSRAEIDFLIFLKDVIQAKNIALESLYRFRDKAA